MQIQIDLPQDVVEEVRRQAESRGVTIDDILTELVRRKSAGGWPAGFFDDVLGAWKGEPLIRPPQPLLEARDEI